MKIEYSKDVDILMINLRDGIPEDAIDLKEGVVLHVDKDGLPVELEILDAAKLSMLKEITVIPSLLEEAAETHDRVV